jgi:hypothetical protein
VILNSHLDYIYASWRDLNLRMKKEVKTIKFSSRNDATIMHSNRLSLRFSVKTKLLPFT